MIVKSWLVAVLASAAALFVSDVANAKMTCGRNSACIDYDSIQIYGTTARANATIKMRTGEVLPVILDVDCVSGATSAKGPTGNPYATFSDSDQDFPSGWREKMCGAS
jgi:hypothetical protein